MDPITGIGLAASVIQIVTFSIDTVSTIREVYQTGSSGKYDDVEYTSGHLASLTRSLQQSLQSSSTRPSTLTKEENDLVDIARRCQECARKLQHELQKLQSRPHSSLGAAARKTARGVWKKRTIEEISKQLETYKSTLETSLLYRLSQRFEAQDLRNDQRFASLDLTLQHIITCLADSHTSLATLTAQQSDKINSHITAQIDRLAQLRVDDRRYDEIIGSLFYPDIFARQEQIDHVFDGIKDSYEWIFEEPQDETVNTPDQDQGGATSERLHAWTERRLIDTLYSILIQSQIPIAVCMFIDGLDEIDGRYDGVINLINALSNQKNVKICLASRPEAIFEEAFDGVPGLKLHHLTIGIIRDYAHVQLSDLIYRRATCDKESGHQAMRLIDMITRRADGVFLWAVLVVRDARDGLQGIVAMDELLRTVDCLPSELEDLFMVMLHRIKPAYKRDAARFLQIALLAPHNESVFGPFQGVTLTLCLLHFILLQQGSEDIPFIPEGRTASEIIEISKTLRTRLQSHTAGLLDLIPSQEMDDLSSVYSLRTDSEPIFSTKIDFVHRSARDFLSRSDKAMEFLAHAGFTEAQVHLSIAKGALAQLVYFSNNDRVFDGNQVCQSRIMAFREAQRHISLAERLLGAAQSDLMQSLECVLDRGRFRLFRKVDLNMTYTNAYIISDTKAYFDVVGMAAAFGMSLYICQRLDISSMAREYAPQLPTLSDDYINRAAPGSLKWTQFSLSEDLDEIATSLLQSSNYRQTLSKYLQLDRDDNASLGASVEWVEDAFAETYLLACCDPSCQDLARILLHEGANPMVRINGVNGPGRRQVRRDHFWEEWLGFLYDSRNKYIRSNARSGSILLEDNCRDLGLTPKTVFDTTKALLARGADLNFSLGQMISTGYLGFLKRPGLNIQINFIVEATAMFLLEECFGKESEWRRFATAVEPAGLKPARRLLALHVEGVPTVDSKHYEKAAKLSSEECDNLWLLIEKWERTGHHDDLKLLESTMEEMWEARKTDASLGGFSSIEPRYYLFNEFFPEK